MAITAWLLASMATIDEGVPDASLTPTNAQPDWQAAVGVGEAVGVADGVRDRVIVPLSVSDAVADGVGEGVRDGDPVGDAETVADLESVDVAVDEADADRVRLVVGVEVSAGVGDGVAVASTGRTRRLVVQASDDPSVAATATNAITRRFEVAVTLTSLLRFLPSG